MTGLISAKTTTTTSCSVVSSVSSVNSKGRGLLVVSVGALVVLVVLRVRGDGDVSGLALQLDCRLFSPRNQSLAQKT